mgnify:CR=1 FL=1
MRIISFSADGIKTAAENGFYDWLKEQDADFVCIQDLRCSEYDLQDNLFFPEAYNAYFFDDIDAVLQGVRRLVHEGHEPILFQVVDPLEESFDLDALVKLEGLEGTGNRGFDEDWFKCPLKKGKKE